MSLWEKFKPRFLKKTKKESISSDPNIVPVPRDDIREKLLDAEVQDFMEQAKKTKEEWIAKHQQRKKEESIKQQKLEEKVAESRDQQIEKLEIPPVYTIFEMMNTFEENEDGTITLPLLKDGEEVKTFDNKKSYQQWVDEKQNKILEDRKQSLTPHEFYIIQGKGMERPFTGKYWWVKDMGTYS
eukprot:CAMPEP_0197009824 /NCGR_PEP_ID=MMETSP1380-20130617/51687_1 /TAXON_ID=5936 /ORGANISM="Euplotes crassus, Strain CT5" /LENGTH=183 /DNA_ID=CAMNT_0042431331 /DNA_START=72 /DNA_END=623 /DNA_ORIENTATION=-